jgi:phosphate transport system protein
VEEFHMPHRDNAASFERRISQNAGFLKPPETPLTAELVFSYCLLLMTLSKDVERLGDYIKNVSEVFKLGAGKVPDGPLKTELKELITLSRLLMTEVGPVLDSQDYDRAVELIEDGRAGGKRSDNLLLEIAQADHTAAEITAMVLLTRFHKRLSAHVVNILSSVVMPLHKVDFYDEKLVADGSSD